MPLEEPEEVVDAAEEHLEEHEEEQYGADEVSQPASEAGSPGSSIKDDLDGGRSVEAASASLKMNNELHRTPGSNAKNLNTNGSTGNNALAVNGRTSLPPKPKTATGGSAPPNPSPSMSYSAQIAQQFSTYQQTPSQERQQRSDVLKHHNDSNNIDSIFGKKPSEMHDAG